MKSQLDEIFQKRMDRKDFLKHVALGVAVLTGTAGIVKLFKPASGASQQKQATTYGYGASVYGGRGTAKQG